ncbi:FHA domain-containing protein [Acidiferrimicrobium sp. IK]|uniref:FtsK/SpoIIIE domain-containing protein n=1 Tax=Acidiferrimicrobium sp. IK TaxID=2871700 RepID=UPI0021CB3347|nr:FtsK/SpoIIIE domain-containing protein [Acidiferrimicrobium sp. IK]MCU4185602.1 FHA domain-containing protein [Acidiferrimicrobium sp. IK]
MKLKLTLERAGDSRPVDLMVTVEPKSTVGALAQYLASSDPSGRAAPGGPYTLAVGLGRTLLPGSLPVSDSGLRSGAVVRVTRAEDDSKSQRMREAAIVRVVGGPDIGREFAVPAGTSIIGRERGCEVQLTDPLVSRQHAKLHVTDVAEVVDLGSANGLVAAGSPVDRLVLRPGTALTVGDTTLSVEVVAGGRPAEANTIAFNRPPRVSPRFDGVELVGPEPPDMPRGQRFPLLPLFAPLILGLVIYLSTHAVASLAFVALSPLLLIANFVEGRNSGRRSYRELVELFRSDIADLTAEATAAAAVEVAMRLEETPSVAACVTAGEHRSSLLWSRHPDLPGYLELRLGLGRLPSRSKVELPQGRQNNRALWKELREAVAPFATVDGVPVVGDLASGGAIGVAGPRHEVAGVARSLLVQAGALHSPADLSIAVCASASTVADWEWVKWLPHCFSGRAPVDGPSLVTTEAGCAALISELLERCAPGDGEAASRPGAAAHTLLLVEDDAPIDRARAVALAEAGSAGGIHVVWLAADLSRLPAVCRTFVEALSSKGAAAAGFVVQAAEVTPLALDTLDGAEAEEVARRMSPLVDAAAGEDTQSDLPRSVSWLSLASADLAHAPEAVIGRWNESASLVRGPRAHVAEEPRPGTLRAVVGQSAAGPHALDLRVHGPHALVGGTTGSGKSELLQSWILSMAATHSPQRVTFLLVDYKGGSAFSECVDLPHTVGLVTDLSPHLVRRALVSLSAELRYRETILNAKGAKDLVELERRGETDAPPSLIIVVDEFAALVQEVPDFVDGVVNVAQRGRSLGLHLILATQRPAGVIKGNLRANTNLRVALRVADEEDSSDVIGSKMAATFDPSRPGRAVSKTGPMALVPFQAAYVGGRSAGAPTQPEVQVETLGFDSPTQWSLPPELTVRPDTSGPTDMERLVVTINEASRIAEVERPRVPWLPELAGHYDLARLPTRRRDDELVYGVADDPASQDQPVIAFHPDTDGNLAVFGTGNSGKSTFLRTLAIAAGLTHRGGPCQIYGLDFGARGLQMLEELPHVGSVIAGTDHERVARLLGMLRDVIEERSARYGKVRAGTITDYRAQSGDRTEPRLLLLLDGMAAFRQAYEVGEYARWFEVLIRIAADGRQVGVHVVVSADRAGALPSALASHIQRRLVLRLADPMDYGILGVPSDVLTESSPPGRGLIGSTELQVAMLSDGPEVMAQSQAIHEMAAEMQAAGASKAPAVGVLAERIHILDTPSDVGGKPVFAVAGETLGPVAFEPEGTLLIAGPRGSGRSTALATVVASLRRWRPDVRLMYFGGRRASLAGDRGWECCALGPDQAAEIAPAVSKAIADSSVPVAVVIEGLADLVGGAADYPMQEMLKLVLADGHLVVAEAETSVLNGSYPLLSMLRNGRTGIVLQPSQLDGALLGAAFPKVRKSDFPSGRGLFVSRGSQPAIVQVVTTE